MHELAEARTTGGAYTENVIPLPDASMRWFEEALIQSSPLSRARVRAILRQCWRDVHNATLDDPPEATEGVTHA